MAKLELSDFAVSPEELEETTPPASGEVPRRKPANRSSTYRGHLKPNPPRGEDFTILSMVEVRRFLPPAACLYCAIHQRMRMRGEISVKADAKLFEAAGIRKRTARRRAVEALEKVGAVTVTRSPGRCFILIPQAEETLKTVVQGSSA